MVENGGRLEDWKNGRLATTVERLNGLTVEKLNNKKQEENLPAFCYFLWIATAIS